MNTPFSLFPDELIKKAENLVVLLKERKQTITFAESCTGGLCSTLITSISGASSVFNEGFITYSNDAKHQLLNVSNDLLKNYGAVSHEVAEAMAQGAFNRAQADCTLSITGIAGPSGGTKEKPVGTVYFGLATKKRVLSNHMLFENVSRDEVRLKAVHHAFNIIIENL